MCKEQHPTTHNVKCAVMSKTILQTIIEHAREEWLEYLMIFGQIELNIHKETPRKSLNVSATKNWDFQKFPQKFKNHDTLNFKKDRTMCKIIGEIVRN